MHNEKDVAPANDFALPIGPIRGVDPTDGAVKTYTGAQVTAWWTPAANSNTPAGGVQQTFDMIGTTGRFIIAFESAQMSTALNGLVDGQTVYLVIQGSTEFRVAIAFTYRDARVEELADD